MTNPLFIPALLVCLGFTGAIVWLLCRRMLRTAAAPASEAAIVSQDQIDAELSHEGKKIRELFQVWLRTEKVGDPAHIVRTAKEFTSAWKALLPQTQMILLVELDTIDPSGFDTAMQASGAIHEMDPSPQST